MQHLNFILFFLLCIPSFSQQVYFNKRYDYNNNYETIWTVLPMDTGYLCIAGYNGILIQYINLEGELKWQKAFSDSSFYYYASANNSFIPTSDNRYALGSAIQDTTGDIDGFLIKFDNDFDTLWTKRFLWQYFNAFYQCKQTPDGGYILIGAKNISPTNTNIWLVKTDSLCNLEWEKTYGGSQTEYSFSVGITNDEGYILSGYTNSFGAGDYDAYVIKTDSAGNVQWSKTYGGPNSDGGYYIIKTSDGGYIGAGAEFDTVLSGSYTQRKPAIIRLDSVGGILWKKTYGPARYGTGLGAIHELPDGSFVSEGQSNNNMGTPNGNGSSIGIIVKVNSEGDSLWYREYEYNDCSSSNDYLRDIKPTADGGFIAAGFFVPFPFSCPGDTGQQDMWVIKLDSCGCLTPLCDSVCAGLVGVEEEVFNREEEIIKAYPNPANNSLTIDYHISQDYNNASIRIYNITGEQVFNYKIINSVGKIQMNTGTLSSGVYFYTLTVNNNTIAREKLIIIK